tara:strand:- start:73 stop:501 length:429 start_codon:yes stop_codon:yes gene_type:complete
MNFFDIDSILEKDEKMSIKRIFDTKGEEYFRNIEKETCLRVLNESNSVVALGGGAFIENEVRDKILKSCFSCWLFLDIKNLVKRISGSTKRPLLNNKNLEKTLKNIYDERKKFYQKADLKIECKNKDKFEITNEIIKFYEKN